MANNHGIITELFPKESRGKALGVLVTAVALGNMVGPSIGGMILSVFNWNYIFYINVPFGIGVFILGLRFLPKGERKDECMDIVGAILQFIVYTVVFWFIDFIATDRTIKSVHYGFYRHIYCFGNTFYFCGKETTSTTFKFRYI